jgi:hypothetical protein
MLSQLRRLHPTNLAAQAQLPRKTSSDEINLRHKHSGVERSAHFDVQMEENALGCQNGYEATASMVYVTPQIETQQPVIVCPISYKGFGSVKFNAFDVDQEMSAIMKRVCATYPAACSESVYQKAVLRDAYLAGLPVMVEREVFSDYGNGSLLMGRVDMEVAGVCLYELKIGKPNIDVHALQLQKYLRAYDRNKEDIQVAKLIYFTSNRLVTHVLRDATPPLV